ncbi:MAG: hypothetical protein K2W95_30515 [Candidatus Obscuribacterales bacterium]|nr:hypothetical protein [Candidatus Obscuribacterales bacterium]
MRSSEATLSPETKASELEAVQKRTAPPRSDRRRWFAILAAAISLLAFTVFDIWVGQQNLIVKTKLPTPLFKEKGCSFFTYVPEPKVSSLLNINANLHAGAKLFAGNVQLKPTSLQSVRNDGRGTFFQTGNFLWLSLPDNSDANKPHVELSVVSPLKLKPWVRFLSYFSMASLLLFLITRPALLTFGDTISRRFPRAHAFTTKLTQPVSSFLQAEKWTIAAIATAVALRVMLLPPVFNFLDTFTTLRAPLSVVGHMPPLYLLLVAGLKAKFGLGHVFLDLLLIVQYSFFAAAMLYLCTAFETVRQKIFAVAAVTLNFYVLLLVGGILTESLALSEQIFLMGACLRIASSRKVSRIHWAVLAISCTLCVLTRHTFVLFAAAPILYCGFQFLIDSKTRKESFKKFALTTAVCALGTAAGLQLSSIAYKKFNPSASMPAGRFGVQVMARGWQEITREDRAKTYDRLASRSEDPLVKATFKVLLALPNSTQPVYDYATIYKSIQDTIRREYGEVDYQRACDPAQLERATESATKIFFANPDQYYLNKVKTFFLQYTQLGELLSSPNPVYQLAVIKSRDSVDVQGVGWNLPEVHWGYLNRCILDHSAISDMWSHLCEDTSRITDRVFSPENKNLLRDCINGRVFWLLDYVNPASNMVLLILGIVFGAWSRRLSNAGALVGFAILLSAIGFDLLHALSTQDTLSRYLAPGSLQLALGVIVVYSEICFGFHATSLANPATQVISTKDSSRVQS